MTIHPHLEADWHAEEIEEGVRAVLSEVLERPLGSIRIDTPLDEGLGVDSLALIQAQVGIEERFGVVMPEIDENAVAEQRTVEDLIKIVAAQSQGGQRNA